MIPTGRLEMQITGDGEWTDITAWWAITQGWDIKRGRESELDPFDVGSFVFTLVNDDGRWTPGLESSPFWPYLARGRGVRMSVLIGGVYVPRFTGTVDAESVWWDAVQTVSYVTVTAHDASAAYALTELRSRPVELLSRYPLHAHWPLGDSSAPARPVTGGLTLTPYQVGVGGELGWGKGTGVASDGISALMTEPADGDNGLMLTTSADVPTLYLSSLFVAVNPSTSGCVMQASWGTYGVALHWDAAAHVFEAVEHTTGPTGIPTDTVIAAHPGFGTSTKAVFLTLGLGGHFLAFPDAYPDGYTPTLPWLGERQYVPSGLTRVTVGGALNLSAGRRNLIAATISHAAMIAGRPSASLCMDILAGAPMPATDAIDAMLSWADLPGVTTILGDVPSISPLATQGVTPGDVIQSVQLSTGARVFVGRDGGLVWRAGEYETAPVVLSMEDVHSDVKLATPTKPVTAVKVGGLTYGTGRSPYEIPALFPTGIENRARAEWILATQTGAPKLTGLAVDLMALPDAEVAPLAALDIGDTLTLTQAPAQMTATALTVERYDEHGSATDWTASLSTSVWPYDGVLIVDDDTFGAIDEWRIL